MKILALVGARPNFVKMAALAAAFREYPAVRFQLAHTGQHSGGAMSDVFFEQLQLPVPDFFLGLNGQPAPTLVAEVKTRFGALLRREKPAVALLVGDVNSTLGGALAAEEAGVPIAHVEAGLRCGGLPGGAATGAAMPEEHNRIETDRRARWLFTTEAAANDNLRLENLPAAHTHFVGNVMLDVLSKNLPASRLFDLPRQLGLRPQKYVLCTLHRNFNILDAAPLDKITAVLQGLSATLPVVFPVHPHTEKHLRQFGFWENLRQNDRVRLLPPAGYLEFLNLMENAALVVTDSGGVQDETTFLQIPCLTYRPSTERPVTVEMGTNQLIYNESAAEIVALAEKLLTDGLPRTPRIPPLWDGRAAQRIAAILTQELSNA